MNGRRAFVDVIYTRGRRHTSPGTSRRADYCRLNRHLPHIPLSSTMESVFLERHVTGQLGVTYSSNNAGDGPWPPKGVVKYPHSRWSLQIKTAQKYVLCSRHVYRGKYRVPTNYAIHMQCAKNTLKPPFIFEGTIKLDQSGALVYSATTIHGIEPGTTLRRTCVEKF